MWRTALALTAAGLVLTAMSAGTSEVEMASERSGKPEAITLFLTGDVMTGRGIDQILPRPGSPELHEPYVDSALTYVELAEEANGPVGRPVDWHYIWGDALEVLEQVSPDLRIINLETAVTTSDDYWQGKTVHYRMNPLNLPALKAAKIDGCSLANNHVLDWGHDGFRETLDTLKASGLACAGAGMDTRGAQAPAIFDLGEKGRVVLFSFGLSSSGIPPKWAATGSRPGVNLLPDMSPETVKEVEEQVRKVKRAGDIVVASIHWGGNWGYDISRERTEFAHGLIDKAGVDLIHGHSSHHVLGLEVYRGKLVIYGCGDLLTDYEGIGGHEQYRGELGLMYFADVDPATGRLISLEMVPIRVKKLRITRASGDDSRWAADVLNREGERFGTSVKTGSANTLRLKWL